MVLNDVGATADGECHLLLALFGGFGGLFEGGGGGGALRSRLTHLFAAASFDALPFGVDIGVKTAFCHQIEAVKRSLLGLFGGFLLAVGANGLHVAFAAFHGCRFVGFLGSHY